MVGLAFVPDYLPTYRIPRAAGGLSGVAIVASLPPPRFGRSVGRSARRHPPACCRLNKRPWGRRFAYALTPREGCWSYQTKLYLIVRRPMLVEVQVQRKIQAVPCACMIDKILIVALVVVCFFRKTDRVTRSHSRANFHASSCSLTAYSGYECGSLERTYMGRAAGPTRRQRKSDHHGLEMRRSRGAIFSVLHIFVK